MACIALSTLLFFVKGEKWKILYVSPFIGFFIWLIYENKIQQHLAENTSFRIDIPLILVLLAYSIVPVLVHSKRLREKALKSA